jgi:UDP-GlcNAc3NAcA epimerase
MSDIFFEELGIPMPDHHLGIGSGPHGSQTGAMLAALEPFCRAGSSRRPPWAPEHLRRQSITAGVHVVGDVMIDAIEFHRERAEARAGVLARFAESSRYYAATVHRAENTDDAGRLRAILAALGRLELPVLLPVHPPTRMSADELALARHGGQHSGGRAPRRSRYDFRAGAGACSPIPMGCKRKRTTWACPV